MPLVRILLVALVALGSIAPGPRPANPPILAFTISIVGSATVDTPVSLRLTLKNISKRTLHIDPLEVSLFSGFHIVDLATGSASDLIGGVTLDEFEPPHPGAPMRAGSSISILKEIGALDKPGTYRITSTASLLLPQAPGDIDLGRSNAVVIVIPEVRPPKTVQAGLAQDGVAFGISLAGTPFAIGDPVRIRCTIYNHRNAPITLYEAAWRRCGTPSVLDVYRNALPSPPLAGSSLDWPEYYIHVPPGKSASSEVDIENWFTFSNAGPFTVTFAKRAYTSTFTSNTISFAFASAMPAALEGRWACRDPHAAERAYTTYTTYRRDGTGSSFYGTGQGRRGTLRTFRFEVRGHSIIYRYSGDQRATAREDFSIGEYGILAKSHELRWHEGAWIARPEVGSDTCVRNI